MTPFWRQALQVFRNEHSQRWWHTRIQCCGHNCFSICLHAQHLSRTQNLYPRQKMFLIFVRNNLHPQQMFPRLRGMETKRLFYVPLVCSPKKNHEQRYVRNIVSSSFATTLERFSLECRKLIAFALVLHCYA